MIYRILVNNREYVLDKSSGEFIFKPDGSLVGVGTAGLITDPSLKIPRFENRRVRFFFTEKGWRDIGQSIVTEAIREGHLVRVIRRKNPTRSQVFYKDADQVAILPSHLKRRRKQSLHRANELRECGGVYAVRRAIASRQFLASILFEHLH